MESETFGFAALTGERAHNYYGYISTHCPTHVDNVPKSSLQ